MISHELVGQSQLMESAIDVDSEVEEDEQAVVKLTADRFNNKKKRKEWLVLWADGSETWEPIGNLVDSDGTHNIALIRYDIMLDAVANGLPIPSLEQRYLF